MRQKIKKTMSSFFEFGNFLPEGRELDKKKLPRWLGFAHSKNFPGGCLGGYTQLELTET